MASFTLVKLAIFSFYGIFLKSNIFCLILVDHYDY